MKPCGHAGADGKCGQRNGALTTLPTTPWTSAVIKMFFGTCPHAHRAGGGYFQEIANGKNERRFEGKYDYKIN